MLSSVKFANSVRKVRPGWNVPLRAVFVSVLIVLLLSLINIGSTTALRSIISWRCCDLGLLSGDYWHIDLASNFWSASADTSLVSRKIRPVDQHYCFLFRLATFCLCLFAPDEGRRPQNIQLCKRNVCWGALRCPYVICNQGEKAVRRSSRSCQTRSAIAWHALLDTAES